MIQFAIGFGIVLNVLSYELIGYTAGGVVIPGYLALFLDQPWRIASTFIVAIVTLGIVQFMSRFVILYGRRKFAALLLVGFFVHWIIDVLAIPFVAAFNTSHIDLRVIGYIVPGLIANDMRNQGIMPTVVIGMLAAMIIRFVMLIIQAGVGNGVGS